MNPPTTKPIRLHDFNISETEYNKIPFSVNLYMTQGPYLSKAQNPIIKKNYYNWRRKTRYRNHWIMKSLSPSFINSINQSNSFPAELVPQDLLDMIVNNTSLSPEYHLFYSSIFLKKILDLGGKRQYADLSKVPIMPRCLEEDLLFLFKHEIKTIIAKANEADILLLLMMISGTYMDVCYSELTKPTKDLLVKNQEGHRILMLMIQSWSDEDADEPEHIHKSKAFKDYIHQRTTDIPQRDQELTFNFLMKNDRKTKVKLIKDLWNQWRQTKFKICVYYALKSYIYNAQRYHEYEHLVEMLATDLELMEIYDSIQLNLIDQRPEELMLALMKDHKDQASDDVFDY